MQTRKRRIKTKEHSDMDLTKLSAPSWNGEVKSLPLFVGDLIERNDEQELRIIGLVLRSPCDVLKIEAASGWGTNKSYRWLKSFTKIGAFIQTEKEERSIALPYEYSPSIEFFEQLRRSVFADNNDLRSARVMEWLGWCPAFEEMKDLWGKASDEEKQFFCERYMDAVKAIVEEASKDERVFDLFAGFLDGNILTRYAANDRFGIEYQGDARKVFLALKHFLREGIVERKPSGYRLVRHKRLAGPYALKFTGGKPLEKWGRMVAIVE